MKCNFIFLSVKELVFIGELFYTVFPQSVCKKNFNNSTLILINLFQIQNNFQKTAVETKVLRYTFHKMTNPMSDFFA